MGGFVLRTTVWACGLNPAACVAAGVAGADVALLGWDLYQGYRLAQAYGHFLPKAVPVPKPQIRPHPPEVEKACSDVMDQYMNNPRPGAEILAHVIVECIGAGGTWPTYKCPL